MTVNPVRVLPFSLLAVIACSGGSNPHVTTCTTAGDTVTLAAWQYASIDPAGGNGCTVYPAAGGSGAQYLLVPQITTGTPGQQTGYRLVGDTLVPAPSGPVPAAARISPAQQFHDYLRLGDQNTSWGLPRARVQGRDLCRRAGARGRSRFRAARQPRAAVRYDALRGRHGRVRARVRHRLEQCRPRADDEHRQQAGDGELVRFERLRGGLFLRRGPRSRVQERFALQQGRILLLDCRRSGGDAELHAFATGGRGLRAGDVHSRVPAHDQLRPACAGARRDGRSAVVERRTLPLRGRAWRAQIRARSRGKAHGLHHRHDYVSLLRW